MYKILISHVRARCFAQLTQFKINALQIITGIQVGVQIMEFAKNTFLQHS